MAILGPVTRAALRKFEASDVVDELRIHHDRIRIAYGNGLVETWDLDGERKRGLRLPRKDLWGRKPIEVSEFSSLRQLDDDYDPAADTMFEYTRHGVRRAGWLDRRLLVHSLVQRLLGEGWMWPSFPWSALEADLHALQTDPQRYAVTTGYLRGQPGRPVAGPPPGFLLCLDAVDWRNLASPGRPTVAEAWSAPHRLRWAIEGLLRRGQSVTRANIIHRMVCGRAEGFPSKAGQWTPASFWIAVLRDVLDLERPLVIDAGHDCGARAVAVGALSGIYLHDPRVAFRADGPLWEGVAEIEPDDGDQGAFVTFVDCQTVAEFEASIDEFSVRSDCVVTTLPWLARDHALRVPGVRVVRYRPRPFQSDAVLAIWNPP